MLMKTKVETPIEAADRLLTKLNSAFCGSLPLEESIEVIKEGETILHKLQQQASSRERQDQINEFFNAIERAKGAIGYEALPK